MPLLLPFKCNQIDTRIFKIIIHILIHVELNIPEYRSHPWWPRTTTKQETELASWRPAGRTLSLCSAFLPHGSKGGLDIKDLLDITLYILKNHQETEKKLTFSKLAHQLAEGSCEHAHSDNHCHKAKEVYSFLRVCVLPDRVHVNQEEWDKEEAHCLIHWGLAIGGLKQKSSFSRVWHKSGLW